MHEGAAWRAYDLDKIGNIKQRRMKASTLVHEVDKLSRLTRLGATPIKIDPTDNLQGPQGGPVQFTFDDFTGTVLTASNGAATSSFSYDALDRRRGEHRSADHSDHVYVWDGNQLVAHGSAGNLTLDVPGDDLDAHLVSIDQLGAGAQWFYHQGPDQSVLAVTGSAGLIEGYTYSAFGELSIWTPSGALTNKSAFGNLFQFQGQVFDASTSTYSMRARQYHPAWGGFLSPDPISTAGGPSVYAFAGSRPLDHRDPLGLKRVRILVGEMQMKEWILDGDGNHWGDYYWSLPIYQDVDIGGDGATISGIDPRDVGRRNLERHLWPDPHPPQAAFHKNTPVENGILGTVKALNTIGLASGLAGIPSLLCRFVPFAADSAPGALANAGLASAGVKGIGPAPLGNVSVYTSTTEDGVVNYVGITNNLARRAAEQLVEREISIMEIPALPTLERNTARGVEQALIEHYGLESGGGSLMNKINSIAKSNPLYPSLVSQGRDLLHSIGYPGF